MTSELNIDASSPIIKMDRGVLVFKINRDILSKSELLPGKNYLTSECDINMTNLTSEKIALRVRTTKRLSYQVDPTYSIILPKQKELIKVYFYTRLNEEIDSKGHKFKFEAFIIKDYLPTNKNVRDYFMEIVDNQTPVKGSFILKNVVFIDDNNYHIPMNKNNLITDNFLDNQVSQFTPLKYNNRQYNTLSCSTMMPNSRLINRINSNLNRSNSSNKNQNSINNTRKYYPPDNEPDEDLVRTDINDINPSSSYSGSRIVLKPSQKTNQPIPNPNKNINTNKEKTEDNDSPKITKNVPSVLDKSPKIKKSFTTKPQERILTEKDNYKSSEKKNPIANEPEKIKDLHTEPSVLKKSFMEIMKDAVNNAAKDVSEKGLLNKKQLITGAIGIFIITIIIGFLFNRKKE